ncbi:MAG: hypothetical protein LUE99_09425 [Bacteroides sp.]|nr:hypothetical protein [Bacteroides sp.]
MKIAIEVANKQCPISMGTAGEISSISFDGKDVVYNLTMNEDYLNLETLEKNPESMKSAVSAMFQNPKGEIKQMLDMVIGAKSGIKFIYKGDNTGKEVECYLNTDDLKGILNQDMSAEESDQQKLEQLVNVTNISCPLHVDEATVLDKLTIEGDDVVYNYTIDEEGVDMATLESNKEQMKQSIKSSLNRNDPSLKTFLETCAKNNKSLIYRYIGKTSGKKVECVFTASEVKRL